MSPEANEALHRIKADYPAVQWAQDAPNTVILWFDHIKAYVHLVGLELDPPIELDEGRARSALDALLGMSAPAAETIIIDEATDVTPAMFELGAPSAPETDPTTAPLPVQDPAPADEPPAPPAPVEF